MDLKALKEKVSILEAAQYLGLNVNSQNKVQCYNSSAHKDNDQHPSLSLDLNKDRFKCFSCSVSGSIIDLVAGYKNITELAAMQELCDKYLGNSKPAKKRNPKPAKPAKTYTLAQIKTLRMGKQRQQRFDKLYNYKTHIRVCYRNPDDRSDKSYLPFTPIGTDKHVMLLKCPPCLYNEQELQQYQSNVVCFVEAEGTVEALKDLGFLATTSGSGSAITSKTLTPEMILKLKDRDVVIFADNDNPGVRMLIGLTELLQKKVKTLSIADIKEPWKHAFNEDMLVKADIKDFIQKYRDTKGAAGLKESIDKMINDARLIEAPFEISDSADVIRDKYYDEKRFVPQKLVEDILKNHKFLYADKQFFHFEKGYWQVVDTDYIAELTKRKLGSLSTITRINESVNDLKLSVLLPADKRLNARPELLNLKNGMLNWIENKLVPHDSNFYSSVRNNASYRPGAKCVRFDKFIGEILDPDTIPLIQEFMGYCLVQDVRFEKAFLLTGPGANGKGTFLGVLRELLGRDNVSEIPLQNLSDRFNTAQLNGKLANIFTDLNAKAMLDTGYFKAIVSGDRLTVERKHQNPFSFEPFSRLVFSCNEIPRSYDKTYAFYRRWIIIPFNKTFSGDQADKSLKSKLLMELDGILLWALEGLHRLFRQEDFSTSKTTTEMMNSYKVSNDNVLQFTNENCIFGDNYITDKRILYNTYKEFCAENSLKPVNNRRFNSDLQDKNIGIYETRNHFSNKRAWKGVGLHEN